MRFTFTQDLEDYLEDAERKDQILFRPTKRQPKRKRRIRNLLLPVFAPQASTASRRQAKIKYLEKMDVFVLPDELQTVQFSFPHPCEAVRNALVLKNVVQSYDASIPSTTGST